MDPQPSACIKVIVNEYFYSSYLSAIVVLESVTALTGHYLIPASKSFLLLDLHSCWTWSCYLSVLMAAVFFARPVQKSWGFLVSSDILLAVSFV